MLVMMSKGWGIVEFHLVFDYEVEFAAGITLIIARYVWSIVGYHFETSKHESVYFYDGYAGYLEIMNFVLYFIWVIYSLRNSSLFINSALSTLKTALLLVAAMSFIS